MKKFSILPLIIALALATITNLTAQERNLKKLSKHKRHKIAHDLIKRGSY